jgi:hypothetical protein
MFLVFVTLWRESANESPVVFGIASDKLSNFDYGRRDKKSGGGA